MRKKGSLNIDKKIAAEVARSLKINPLQILLHIANGDIAQLNLTEPIPIAVRAKAAGDACKYLYPQMRSVDGTLKVDDISKRPYESKSDEELDAM